MNICYASVFVEKRRNKTRNPRADDRHMIQRVRVCADHPKRLKGREKRYALVRAGMNRGGMTHNIESDWAERPEKQRGDSHLTRILFPSVLGGSMA